MQVIEKKELFTEVSAEESVTASGGAGAVAGAFALAAFLAAQGGLPLTPDQAVATIAVILA
jgi:hypothetical protein